MFSSGSINQKVLSIFLVVAIAVTVLAGYLYLPQRTYAAVTQTGSNLEINLGSGNTGSDSTIDVPSDAELIIVGLSGYSQGGAQTNFFSGGSMTFTKGGSQVAMTPVSGADASTSYWQAGMFYLVLPDTGDNKTLAWDWAGAGGADQPVLASVTFWKGIDTSSPARDSDGAQAASTPYTTPTLTAQSGDLIVAWVGAYANGGNATIDSWSNLNELTEVTNLSNGDGAWATGSPSGDTAVAASTDTNFDDGGILALVLKPAPPADSTNPNVNIRGGGSATNSNVQIRGGTGWYNQDWEYRKAITIQKEKVVNTDQTNFPVLIDVTDSGLQANAQSDGDDILFTMGDGVTRAPHEIELYTTATGRLAAWVKVPTLYTDRDTTIYMYYGNAATSSEQTATQVWDSNYKGVWHMNDNAANTTVTGSIDSTNLTNVANTNTKTVALQIGNALTYNSTTDESTGTISSNALPLTLSGIIKWNNTETAFAYNTAYGSNNGVRVGRASNNLNLGFGGVANYTFVSPALPITLGTTYYVAVTVSGDNGTAIGYLGAIGGSLNNSSLSVGTMSGTPSAVDLGGWGSGPTLDGVLDEVRISNSVRSADWITTEYNNISATSTFYTISSQETKSSITTGGSVKFR